MKAEDLVKIWGAPDNSRLTNKQFSFRLPVHVAARIAALCEMYPTKSRTQIVGDLLSAALREVEQGFPEIRGKEIGRDPDTGAMIYEDVGPYARYRALANRANAELEHDMGNDDPKEIVPERGMMV